MANATSKLSKTVYGLCARACVRACVCVCACACVRALTREELSKSYSDLGAALSMLHKTEEGVDDDVAKDAKKISKTCSTYYELNGLLENSELSFEASVLDYKRTLTATKAMLRNRQKVLVKYHAAQATMEKKKEAYAAASGPKAEKLQQEAEQATAKFEELQRELEKISEECKIGMRLPCVRVRVRLLSFAEWRRFDETTLVEIKNSFVNFIGQNVSYETKVISLWGNVVQ
jgi:hypothetical protein